jgi:PAS domain-containing protein
MAQKPVELILLRQLAGYLAVPILVFDPAGNLLFYNEPAEALLGRRFDEAGELALEEWYRLLEIAEEDGSPLPREARPLMVALKKRRPAHRALRLRSFTGEWKQIQATALPLEGQGGRYLGAMAFVWEVAPP